MFWSAARRRGALAGAAQPILARIGGIRALGWTTRRRCGSSLDHVALAVFAWV
jgi:hypothetical protein